MSYVEHTQIQHNHHSTPRSALWL